MKRSTKHYTLGALSGAVLTLLVAVLLYTVLEKYAFASGLNRFLEAVTSGIIYVFFWSELNIALTIIPSLWSAPEWHLYLMTIVISLVYNATILAIVFRVIGYFIERDKDLEPTNALYSLPVAGSKR
jgi:succinate dehydrogenase hydrophobic anchor subunit